MVPLDTQRRPIAGELSGVPPSGETRTIPVSRRSNKIPLASQTRANGALLSAHTLIATPPAIEMRFSSEFAQNTMDWPSGEKAGRIPGSAPAIGLDADSARGRINRWPPAE